MNFAFLISSIGSLIFSTISPIATNNDTSLSNSTHNVTNRLECYGCTNYIKLNDNKNISDIFKNCTQKIITCEKDNQVCGVNLIQRESTDNYSFVIGCIKERDCFTQQPSIWKYLDYDIPTPFRFSECCEGDKCNTEENLTKTQKLLTTGIRYPADHDELCPGYSSNHRSIILQPNTFNKINIVDSSNLLLTIDKVEDIFYKNKEYSYTGSLWKLNKLYIFSFNLAGKMNDFTNEYNFELIKNNKIFYVVANSMHICNFTKEDEAIIEHIDRFEGTEDTSTTINIAVENPIIATTKNNGAINQYIILNNAILIIISWLF